MLSFSLNRLNIFESKTGKSLVGTYTPGSGTFDNIKAFPNESSLKFPSGRVWPFSLNFTQNQPKENFKPVILLSKKTSFNWPDSIPRWVTITLSTKGSGVARLGSPSLDPTDDERNILENNLKTKGRFFSATFDIFND